MRKAAKKLKLLNMVDSAVSNALNKVSSAKAQLDFRSHPMYGFKEEDYSYSKGAIREFELRHEQAQQELDDLVEVQAYLAALLERD